MPADAGATQGGARLLRAWVCVVLESSRLLVGIWGFPKLGVPHWGSYFQGILMLGDLYLSPIFVNSHLVNLDKEVPYWYHKENEGTTLGILIENSHVP